MPDNDVPLEPTDEGWFVRCGLGYSVGDSNQRRAVGLTALIALVEVPIR